MPTPDYLLVTAALCLLLSLGLAWLASLIVYAKVSLLKKCFPATHQLIRAHIDYLLMSLLLVMAFYLSERLQFNLPGTVVVLLCVGALYNPFGFIVLAIKPEMANGKTFGEKLRILLGFLPATLGFGYVGVVTLAAVL